jgi:hypothetical protein
MGQAELTVLRHYVAKRIWLLEFAAIVMIFVIRAALCN